jgi:LAO/AO transport system kinase
VTGRPMKPVNHFLEGLRLGDRIVLSECITLVESMLPEKQKLAQKILEQSEDFRNRNSIRIAITGTPGVGKSTFIERFGLLLASMHKKVAVLSIDPSSPHSKGSILGDKTRMPLLSTHPLAYIRPSPSGNVLGGVAANTKETILLCEAAQFDIILVETVGVGQSENIVNNITDLTVLLLQPGAGDDLQGIKRGIVEMADIVIVHKADGMQYELARQTKKFYEEALHYFHHDIPGWRVPVVLASSLDNSGIDLVYNHVWDLFHLLVQKQWLEERRISQELHWFEHQIPVMVYSWLKKNKQFSASIEEIIHRINNDHLNASIAFRILYQEMEHIFKNDGLNE